MTICDIYRDWWAPFFLIGLIITGVMLIAWIFYSDCKWVALGFGCFTISLILIRLSCGYFSPMTDEQNREEIMRYRRENARDRENTTSNSPLMSGIVGNALVGIGQFIK